MKLLIALAEVKDRMGRKATSFAEQFMRTWDNKPGGPLVEDVLFHVTSFFAGSGSVQGTAEWLKLKLGTKIY